MAPMSPIFSSPRADASTLMQIVQARHRNALNAALGLPLAPVRSPRSPWIGPPVTVTSLSHLGELPHTSLLALYRYYLGDEDAESEERTEMEAAVASMIGLRSTPEQ